MRAPSSTAPGRSPPRSRRAPCRAAARRYSWLAPRLYRPSGRRRRHLQQQHVDCAARPLPDARRRAREYVAGSTSSTPASASRRLAARCRNSDGSRPRRRCAGASVSDQVAPRKTRMRPPTAWRWAISARVERQRLAPAAPCRRADPARQVESARGRSDQRRDAAAARHTGSQLKHVAPSAPSARTRPCSAGMPCSAMASGVQPSLRCTERTGRGWLIRKISLLRTVKIWPLTSARRVAGEVHRQRRDLGRRHLLDLFHARRLLGRVGRDRADHAAPGERRDAVRAHVELLMSSAMRLRQPRDAHLGGVVVGLRRDCRSDRRSRSCARRLPPPCSLKCGAAARLR